ncbi:MAG TPA: metallopeptidase family protein [Nitrospirota bacterium]|nr:metallopeptidase family protein [Nitrospirota bacterium]
MDRPSFEKLVARSLQRLPGKFRKRLRNLVIDIEDQPPQTLLDDMGISSGTLFGLYQGVPLPEREWNYGNALPDRIVIYQKVIEGAVSSDDKIEEIVFDTVVHEIGHYFGYDDDTLHSIEDEKRKNRKEKEQLGNVGEGDDYQDT